MSFSKIVLFAYLIISIFSCKKEVKEASTSTIKIKSNTAEKVDKLPYFNTPDFAPTWLSTQSELKKLHKIPSFNFKNQLGEEVTNSTFEGKIYLASFFFTTCTNICLEMTENMRQLQKMYANDEDVMFISHSVLPSVDTVEVLKEYGEKQQINPKKWQLVTGDKEKIYELAREAYFADDLYKETQDKNRFVHTENFILVDQKGHIRGVYNGTLPAELSRIERHIDILKKE